MEQYTPDFVEDKKGGQSGNNGSEGGETEGSGKNSEADSSNGDRKGPPYRPGTEGTDGSSSGR